MALNWRLLNVSNSATDCLPPLLISAEYTADSYTVQIADLIHIWRESLDRQAIITRSQDEGTSIDPSDGDQMQIFLSKIKSGVEGDRGTTSAISFNNDAGRPTITLDLTVTLPGGLAALQWPINLAVAPQSLLTDQFTIPLLEAQHERLQEIASLAELLKDKDHIIQKLVDKLEEQGTQLGQIFPQVAGRGGRKTNQKQAEEKVKGLRHFDIETWRDGLDTKKSRNAAHLLESVFRGKGSESLGLTASTYVTTVTDRWWESVQGETIELSTGEVAINTSRKGKESSKSVLKAEDSMEDDDFQVQGTPPRTKSITLRNPLSNPIDDDSTSDDDDLDAPSQRSKIPDSFPPSPPPVAAPQNRKKLGAIGGRKFGPKSPSPVHEDTTDSEDSPPKHKEIERKQFPKRAAVDDDTTDDEASSPVKPTPNQRSTPTKPPPVDEDTTDDQPSSPIEPAPKKEVSLVPQPPPKKKGGLGKIGGRKEPPAPPKEETPAPAEPVKQKKGKLGTIGGKIKETMPVPPAPTESTPGAAITTQKNAPSASKRLGTIEGRDRTPAKEISVTPDADQSGASRGRSVKREETPPPRETSEERADQKRLELKRELEIKAKAPVKKKRKF